jgi:hypothetical protein
VLEQICLGPHEPSGFAGLFDGAKGLRPVSSCIDISVRIAKLPPPRAVAGPSAIPPIRSHTLIQMRCNGSRKN